MLTIIKIFKIFFYEDLNVYKSCLLFVFNFRFFTKIVAKILIGIHKGRYSLCRNRHGGENNIYTGLEDVVCGLWVELTCLRIKFDSRSV